MNKTVKKCKIYLVWVCFAKTAWLENQFLNSIDVKLPIFVKKNPKIEWTFH